MRRGLLAAVAVAAGFAVSGCGGESDGREGIAGLGPRIDVPLRIADCTDWRNADTAERLGTVRALKLFAGGPTGSPGGFGRTLPDEDAYRLLERWCRLDFARSFHLYKLYVRAAAFQHIPRGPYGQGG